MGTLMINQPLRLLVLALVLCSFGLLAGAERSSATVLCKTATNPCTGGTYGKGSTIEASLKSGTSSELHPPFGTITCNSSSIKGEVTNPGGEGESVSGTLTSLSFSSCNASVTVLKKGTFRIESISGEEKLVLAGFETTVAYLGLHCVFAGEIFIPFNGGEMASIGATATVGRWGGTSGAFCGSTAQWTANYTITSPEPLYVAET